MDLYSSSVANACKFELIIDRIRAIIESDGENSTPLTEIMVWQRHRNDKKCVSLMNIAQGQIVTSIVLKNILTKCANSTCFPCVLPKVSNYLCFPYSCLAASCDVRYECSCYLSMTYLPVVHSNSCLVFLTVMYDTFLASTLVNDLLL